jgi:Ca2+/Na+ antiporter
MSMLSWLYMLSVWTVILLLNIFCFYRIFTIKEKQDSRDNRDRK